MIAIRKRAGERAEFIEIENKWKAIRELIACGKFSKAKNGCTEVVFDRYMVKKGLQYNGFFCGKDIYGECLIFRVDENGNWIDADVEVLWDLIM